MEIYIDNDYKCHISNDGTMREFDVTFFDGVFIYNFNKKAVRNNG